MTRSDRRVETTRTGKLLKLSEGKDSRIWTIRSLTIRFYGQRNVRKSIFSSEYVRFLDVLRKARHRADLTQEQLGQRIGTTQSFISKCERGERRLDVVELRAWCQALGISFSTFIADLEKTFAEGTEHECSKS